MEWERSALKQFARDCKWIQKCSALGISGHGQAHFPRGGRRACKLPIPHRARQSIMQGEMQQITRSFLCEALNKLHFG